MLCNATDWPSLDFLSHLSYLLSSSWSHFSYTQFFSLMLFAINSLFSFHVFNTGSYWPGLFHASTLWLTGGNGQRPHRELPRQIKSFPPIFSQRLFVWKNQQLQQVSEVFHRKFYVCLPKSFKNQHNIIFLFYFLFHSQQSIKHGWGKV